MIISYTLIQYYLCIS